MTRGHYLNQPAGTAFTTYMRLSIDRIRMRLSSTTADNFQGLQLRNRREEEKTIPLAMITTRQNADCRYNEDARTLTDRQQRRHKTWYPSILQSTTHHSEDQKTSFRTHHSGSQPTRWGKQRTTTNTRSRNTHVGRAANPFHLRTLRPSFPLTAKKPAETWVTIIDKRQQKNKNKNKKCRTW